MPAVRTKTELQTQKTKVSTFQFEAARSTEYLLRELAVQLERANSENSLQLANSYHELLEYVVLPRLSHFEESDFCLFFREFSSKELRTVGNYTLGHLIGKGSFGKVYLATHRLTNGSKVHL